MTALFAFDPPTALRFVGFVYALMAATVWLLLRRHKPVGLAYWCLGGSSLAAAALLLGLRNVVPDWMSFQLAHLLIYSAYALRVSALRLEMGAAPRLGLGLGLAVAGMVVYILCEQLHSISLRVQVATLMQVLTATWLAVTAMQVARSTKLRSALWIGGAYSAFAVALFVMTVGLTLVSQAPPVNDNRQLGMLFATLVGTAAGLYGNFGYVGMSLERLRSKDLKQATALAREAALRSAAEQNAAQLQDLLHERDEMLRLLAHEVRQPLNNASAALQSASMAQPPEPDGSTMAANAVDQRVQRARRVLGQIIGTLDNALAATTTLAGTKQIAGQDVDLELLLGLSLGDLEASQRARVEIERLTQARTVTLDFGLLRLALRNLLSNALIFSPPGSPVLLRVIDHEEPLTLVFEVLDRGPGLEPDLQDRLFLRGARGRGERSGHGLGLYVVRRVAEVHGGRVTVQPREGGGLVFGLELPQGQAD